MKTKRDGYWNIKQNVFEEAKKYKTRNKFNRLCNGAYRVALRNGWLDEMDWFEEVHKPNGYWTKERVFEEAKKYNTKQDFKNGNSSAHSIATKNKWLDEMNWFVKPNIVYNKKWTKEKVFEEARKYNTKWEFGKGCRGAYQSALRNGWLDEMDWFEELHKPRNYWTKERVFEEARKYNTKWEFGKGCGGAYKSAYKNGWLSEMNWFVKPNIVCNKKWTKERVFEEARKYQTRKILQINCNRAYNVARVNGWLDEMDWLEDGRLKLFTDKIDCVYRYLWEINKTVYVGRTINRKKRDKSHRREGTVYKYALNNFLKIPQMEIIEDNLTIEEGLDREDYWVNYYKNNGYNVLNIAKTGKTCGSLGAIKSGKWSKKNVFEEAKKYQTRTEFRKKCRTAYDIAHINGWLDEMDWLEEVHKPNGYWTKERVFEEARKYNTIQELRKGCRGAYDAARRKELFEEIDWLEDFKNVKEKTNRSNKKVKNFWTKESVFEESKKYSTRGDFSKGCGGAYQSAYRNGWLDEMDWLSKLWNKKWTKERVFEEAKKYQTRTEFSKCSSAAYENARQNGWLNELFPKCYFHQV